ncbi:hypothetical protein A9Q81_25005 [Gammaproteobacteria bacterium 42_54_T18]|nr:hypothetical protein A9Q81_25005 [Gammaproteobacteria bacterium 42_54_T18]
MKEVLCVYSTSACHLCDLALRVIDAALSPDYFEKVIIDIADSDELIELYGVRIPVLKVQRTGDELGWPFNEDDLIEFVNRVLFTDG